MRSYCFVAEVTFKLTTKTRRSKKSNNNIQAMTGTCTFEINLLSVSQCWCDYSKSTSSLSTPTLAIWSRLMTSLVPRTSSKSLKYWQNSGDAPRFLLFSLAALYAAFRFLVLFLHCVTVFSRQCLFTSALNFCHTVADFGVSSKKMFSFQSFTRASVCFADQRSLFVFDWITFFYIITSLYSLVKLFTYLKYSPYYWSWL